MWRKLLLVVFICGFWGTWAHAADLKVINAKAGFPEGPLFKDGKLYYVEYGTHKVMTWDGESNAEFWRKDGCGPSAIVGLPGGDFLVTCYQNLRTAVHKRCRCRECGVQCAPLNSICEVCGTQDPVRLPFVWLCYATITVVILGAILAWVWSVSALI